LIKSGVQLDHLSNFYKRALEKSMTGVHPDTKKWHSQILRYASASYFQFKPLKNAF